VTDSGMMVWLVIGCRYIFKQGHADAWLHLYTNGKSAVRPDAPGVTQGGPHTFLGPADKR
jgi:hypothetical protein